MKKILLQSALSASLLAAPLFAQATAVTKPAKPMSIGTAGDKVGKEPTHFLPMVGHWVVAEDEGKKVVMVDGREWKRGQPSGGLADKAREIYGARHEEFIDNVNAFAYFPIAVAKDVANFENGEITVKFKMIGGVLDRCSGILFNVKPNGDYLTIRFNGTEDNLVLWTFKDGKRSFVKRGTKNVPLELGTWNEIKVVTSGTSIKGYLNGELLIEHTWADPISGKIGLWSKTDSISEFEGFTVTPVKQP